VQNNDRLIYRRNKLAKRPTKQILSAANDGYDDAHSVTLRWRLWAQDAFSQSKRDPFTRYEDRRQPIYFLQLREHGAHLFCWSICIELYRLQIPYACELTELILPAFDTIWPSLIQANKNTKLAFGRDSRLSGQEDPAVHHSQLAIVADYGKLLHNNEDMIEAFERLRLYHYTKSVAIVRQRIESLGKDIIPSDRLINLVFNLAFVDREWDRRTARRTHAPSPVLESRIHASRGRKLPGTPHQDALLGLIRARGGLGAMERGNVAELIWA
jgi:hypothetical protein